MKAPFPDLRPRQPIPSPTEIAALLRRKQDPKHIDLTPKERAAFEAFRAKMRAKAQRENTFWAGDPHTSTWMR